MITRFFGLHKIKFVKASRTERIYFVIMANAFNTTRKISIRYDLKGSTHGRFTKRNPDGSVKSGVALKDLDWIEDDRTIKLQPETRSLIL